MSDIDIANQDIASIQSALSAVDDAYSGVGVEIGSWFGIGDDGVQEKGAAKITANTSIKAVQRLMVSGVVDDKGGLSQDAANRINDQFNIAIKSLREIGAWSDETNFFTAVTYTVVASVEQIDEAVSDAADWVAEHQTGLIVGAGVLALVVVVVAIKL